MNWGEMIHPALENGISKGFEVTWPYFILVFVIAFIGGLIKNLQKKHNKRKR